MSSSASRREDTSSTHPTIELLEAIGDAFNRHDVDAIVDFFAEDGEFLNATGLEIFGSRHSGRSELRAFFSGLMAECPDIRWEPIDNRVSGDKGYSEWRRTCTLPDGTAQDWLGLDIFTFRDGKVVRKDTYFKHVN